MLRPLALPTPPPNTNPIPNNPFYSLPTYYVQGATGPLVLGSGLFVNYATSTLSSTGGGGGAVASIIGGAGIGVSSPTGNVTLTNTGVTSLIAGSGISLTANTGAITISSTSSGGTVTSITAGSGIAVSPATTSGGTITTSGTLQLANSGVTAGSYTNANITVDLQGRITAAANGTGVTSVTGTLPISVTVGTTPVVSVADASLTGCGVVQLSNSLTSNSVTEAATPSAVKTAFDTAVAAIPKACLTAKGGLVTATAANIPVALPVGTDGYVLTADSNCTEGIKWAAGGGGGTSATPTTEGTVYACTEDSSGTANTALGYAALGSLAGGAGNVAIGICAGCAIDTGVLNTALGAASGCNLTGGSQNVLIGPGAGCGLTAGNLNVLVGLYAGCAYTGTESNNIILGNSDGVVGENDTITISTGSVPGAIRAKFDGGGALSFDGSSYGTLKQVLISNGPSTQPTWASVNSAIAAPNYGSFVSVGSQAITTVNVAQPMTFDPPLAATNFSLSGGSQIVAAEAGLYNFQFSAQLVSTAGGGGIVEIWPVINSFPVPDSNTQFSVKNVNEYEFAALNYVFNLAAGDTLELYWVTNNANLSLFGIPSAFSGPDIPAVIATIVPVGA